MPATLTTPYSSAAPLENATFPCVDDQDLIKCEPRSIHPPDVDLRVLPQRNPEGHKVIWTMQSQATETNGSHTLRLEARQRRLADLLSRKPGTVVPDMLMRLLISQVGIH